MTDIIYSRDNPHDIETVETGLFRWRAGRQQAWQTVRIAYQDGRWWAWINGQPVRHTGATMAKEIPWLLYNAPFHRVAADEYIRLMTAHQNGHAEANLRQAVV